MSFRRYRWQSARRLTSPVLAKGHLGLWTVPEDLVKEVLRLRNYLTPDGPAGCGVELEGGHRSVDLVCPLEPFQEGLLGETVLDVTVGTVKVVVAKGSVVERSVVECIVLRNVGAGLNLAGGRSAGPGRRRLRMRWGRRGSLTWWRLDRGAQGVWVGWRCSGR